MLSGYTVSTLACTVQSIEYPLFATWTYPFQTTGVALGSSRPFHSDVHQTLAVDLAGRSPKAWLHSGATPPKCHDRKVVDSSSEAWHEKLDSICLDWFGELITLKLLHLSVG